MIDFFKDKKVLITGHTGFKGSWLSQILLGFGARVSGVALEPNTDPSLFKILGLEDKLNHHICDIRDFEKVKEIFEKEKPEIVFHLAAQPLVRDSYDDPLYTFQTNVIGTVNVLEAIRQVSTVRSGVIITTDKVYAEQDKKSGCKEDDKLGGWDPYSGSKAAAEIAIDSYIKSFFNSKKIASARSGNVIGGGDWSKYRIVPDIIQSNFKNKELVIRCPNSIRPWQHVLEPSYGYLLLAEKLYEGKISGALNFGPNESSYLTVKELLERLSEKSYSIKEDKEKHEAELLKLDISKAKEVLGWKPVLDINTAIKLTANWYSDFYNGKNMVEVTNSQIKFFFEKI